MVNVSGAFGDALLKIIEKLTGKASNVELNFKNLTLDIQYAPQKLLPNRKHNHI